MVLFIISVFALFIVIAPIAKAVNTHRANKTAVENSSVAQSISNAHREANNSRMLLYAALTLAAAVWLRYYTPSEKVEVVSPPPKVEKDSIIPSKPWMPGDKGEQIIER